MAVTAINASAGDPAANCYCTLAESNQIASDHPYGAKWTDDYGDDEKTQALLLATTLIDERFIFGGHASSATQRLAFPRAGLRQVNGWLVASSVVPDALKRATVLYAMQLRLADRTADNEVETQGIKMVGVGSTQVVFTGNTVAKPVPDAVCHALAPWGFLRVGRGSVSLVRA